MRSEGVVRFYCDRELFFAGSVGVESDGVSGLGYEVGE